MYVSDHQRGDLSDIIRSVNHSSQSEPDGWHFSENSDACFQQLPTCDFDTSIRDSLLHELTGTASCFESGPEKSGNNDNGGGGDQIQVDQNMQNIGVELTRPSNIFSRVIQLSPIKPLSMAVGNIGDSMVKIDHGVRISSPRIPGIKRRKSLAKKVVCIPAPATANSSRPSSGEVVPSDLWAWRKYGQKPIKGSPYPRGYYRCSSSKGCSARKQVERSRTDPNMLVITYTSEHNHPWPTQRNALAGSTRSTNPSKNQRAQTSANSSFSTVKELKDIDNTVSTSSSSLPMVKEEEVVVGEMIANGGDVFDKLGFYGTNTQSGDFFADLAELESDPIKLMFEKSDEEKESNCKELDTFVNMFDWEENSFEDQSSRGL